jgi:hypothetical protein
MEQQNLFGLKDKKEHTFEEGIDTCINLTNEVITLWVRGYYEEETTEDVLEDLIRRMKGLK